MLPWAWVWRSSRREVERQFGKTRNNKWGFRSISVLFILFATILLRTCGVPFSAIASGSVIALGADLILLFFMIDAARSPACVLPRERQEGALELNLLALGSPIRYILGHLLAFLTLFEATALCVVPFYLMAFSLRAISLAEIAARLAFFTALASALAATALAVSVRAKSTTEGSARAFAVALPAVGLALYLLAGGFSIGGMSNMVRSAYLRPYAAPDIFLVAASLLAGTFAATATASARVAAVHRSPRGMPRTGRLRRALLNVISHDDPSARLLMEATRVHTLRLFVHQLPVLVLFVLIQFRREFAIAFVGLLFQMQRGTRKIHEEFSASPVYEDMLLADGSELGLYGARYKAAAWMFSPLILIALGAEVLLFLAWAHPMMLCSPLTAIFLVATSLALYLAVLGRDLHLALGPYRTPGVCICISFIPAFAIAGAPVLTGAAFSPIQSKTSIFAYFAIRLALHIFAGASSYAFLTGRRRLMPPDQNGQKPYPDPLLAVKHAILAPFWFMQYMGRCVAAGLRVGEKAFSRHMMTQPR